MSRYNIVYVEITDNCNLSCDFCPVHRKKLNGYDFCKMELPVFEKICSQICKITDKMTYHVLGEPLVVEKLGSYLDISEKYNLKVVLTTNGMLVDKKAHILTHNAICMINISVTSIFPNNLNIKEYFDKIFYFMENYHNIRKNMFFNLRLWNYKNSDISDNKNALFIDMINKKMNISLPYSVDLGGRKSLKVNDYIYINFDNLFEFPDKYAARIGDKGRCHGLGTHFGILCDGTVIPCCLDYSGSISLGNVKDNSITDILNTHKALRITEGFKKNILIENTCKNCDFIKRFK